MIDLIMAFDNLKPSDSQDNTMVYALPLPIFTNHRIGKSNNGKPLLFLSAKTGSAYSSFPNIQLQNLSVTFNSYCSITSDDTIKEGIFTIVSFLGNTPELQNYFLKLCAQIVKDLGNTPTPTEIYTQIYRLIELLKALTQPPLKTAQGLFAELIIIEQSYDLPTLLQAWHAEPTDRYDFTCRTQHLEVKSNSNQKRQHHFSLEQLMPLQNHTVTVASVFVERSNSGITIDQLKEHILNKLPNRIDLQHILTLTISKTLGNSLIDAQSLKFNYELATQSIVFYNSQDLPSILPVHIPLQITEVHFRLDLKDAPYFNGFRFES